MENSKTELQNDPDFLRLKALRAKLSGGFSVLVLGLFALFVVASVLFRGAMSASIFRDSPFTLAILAAFLMVVVPVLLAAIFLRKSDREIEPLRSELAEKQKR